MTDTKVLEPSTTTRRSARATESDSSAPSVAVDPRRRVHFVLQGKGGIGKSFVASLLVQYYQENRRPVQAFDTDPVNPSLVSLPGLGAKSIRLLDDDTIAVREVDRLIEDIITSDSDVVIDNGAASFLPLSRYLLENDIASILTESNREMVIHTIITGGGTVLDTLKGLDSVVRHFPSSVKVVVWLNEFFGPLTADGVQIEDTRVYQENRNRVLGLIRLKKLNPLSFGADLGDMLERKLTFAEAVSSPETMVVTKQRLVMIRRDIFEQLAQVI